MDQATAAVWASAVAGISGAAGATLGSVIAGRSARSQAVHVAVHDKQRRRETELEKNYASFRDKSSAAIRALHEAIQALCDERPATNEVAAKATLETQLSYYDDVWLHGQREVIGAAGAVCEKLNTTLVTVIYLLKKPEDARDSQSPGMQRWGFCMSEAYLAHGTFAHLMGEKIRMM